MRLEDLARLYGLSITVDLIAPFDAPVLVWRASIDQDELKVLNGNRDREMARGVGVNPHLALDALCKTLSDREVEVYIPLGSRGSSLPYVRDDKPMPEGVDLSHTRLPTDRARVMVLVGLPTVEFVPSVDLPDAMFRVPGPR